MSLQAQAWKRLKADGAFAALTNRRTGADLNKTAMRFKRLQSLATPNGQRVQTAMNVGEFDTIVAKLDQAKCIVGPDRGKFLKDDSGEIRRFVKTLDHNAKVLKDLMVDYRFVLDTNGGRLKELLVVESDTNSDRENVLFQWIQDRPGDRYSQKV